MKHLFALWLITLALLSPLRAALPLEDSANAAAVRTQLKAQAEPWGIPGCVAAWDWRDVVLNGNRIAQWNDKTGNGYHLTHANNSTRAILTATGATFTGGAYLIDKGGVPGLSTQAFTMVWIGRDWVTEDSNSGLTSSTGWLYSLGSQKPQVGWSHAYSITQGAGIDFYTPGPIFPANGAPAIFGQSCGTANTTYFVNGSIFTKSSYTAATGNTLAYMFSGSTGTNFNYRPTYAVLIFNRALAASEMASIAAFYGAPASPGGDMVYCFGSSTPNAMGAGQTQLGCVQLFCDWIGASRNIYSWGGASWNGAADALATTGVTNVHRGYRNIHVFIPQHNDLAAHVPVATCLTKITDAITRIRAVDPTASFILGPVTPRSVTFSNGQTVDDFDVDRLAFNQGLADIATAQAGVVYADAMTIPGIRYKADAGVGPMMHTDGIHLAVAGHAAYARSLYRAYLSLLSDSAPQ